MSRLTAVRAHSLKTCRVKTTIESREKNYKATWGSSRDGINPPICTADPNEITVLPKK